MALPLTSDRVSANTSDEINKRIHRRTKVGVTRAALGGCEAIDRRLLELDREWDIERSLETMASTFTLVGLGLGLLRSRKWFALPLVVQGFFLQHALQGWCPPLPLLRRLGVRTAAEIDQERHALKALRGDYSDISTGDLDEHAAGRALQAASTETALESSVPGTCEGEVQ